MSREAAKFFDETTVYQQVLDYDYMSHAAIYRGVARLLAEQFAARPVSVLDLGCGSARHLSEALAGRAIGGYVGYDLAEAPLVEARRNLEGLGCALDLKLGDLLDALRAEGRSFDLIFCGFSLHHLTADKKKEFFRQAHRRLNAGGLLLVIDPAREEDEPRPVYLDHYCGWIRSEWREMSTVGHDAICEHIRANDYPETACDLRAMGLEDGFDRVSELERYGWHHTWSFEKLFAKRVAIRPALPDDAAAIARVHVGSWRTTYKGIVPDDYIAKFATEERERVWRRIIGDEKRGQYVCIAEEESGSVVGFASGGPERSGKTNFRGELYAIYLLDGFQRRGVGRRLIAALARRLLEDGLDSMIVWVLAANPARNFYAALGGAVAGEKPAEIGGAHLTEIAYGWSDVRRLLA